MTLNVETDAHVVFDAVRRGSKKDVDPPIIHGEWRERAEVQLMDPGDFELVKHLTGNRGWRVLEINNFETHPNPEMQELGRTLKQMIQPPENPKKYEDAVKGERRDKVAKNSA